jgi:hypothetical protein
MRRNTLKLRVVILYPYFSYPLGFDFYYQKIRFSYLSLRFIDTCMIFTCYFKDLLKTFEGAS